MTSLLHVLRWLLPAVLPAVLLAVAVWRSDKNREPGWLVALTFLQGALFGGAVLWLEARAAKFTGLDLRASVAGEAGALLFLFAFVAPMREAAKVAAAWGAFRSRHFDEPYDGLIYAGASALGFAAVENATLLRQNPAGLIWFARAAAAFPAHLFFACAWGYALGRSKTSKRPGALFLTTWFSATMAHALYTHFVFGRGPGAIVAVVPLLAMMGFVVWFAAKDLRGRGDRLSRPSDEGLPEGRLSRMTFDLISQPPSLRAVRDALRRADRPLMIRWVVIGAFVTMGAMFAGLAAAVAFGHFANVDFSVVDEHDVSTTAPVALLGSGLLAAFPLSGFLLARASNLPTLLEPALASAVAIVVMLVVLGLANPVALVFALAFSPIAWALACAGAWVGRPL